jgi:hypothetical protein
MLHYAGPYCVHKIGEAIRRPTIPCVYPILRLYRSLDLAVCSFSSSVDDISGNPPLSVTSYFAGQRIELNFVWPDFAGIARLTQFQLLIEDVVEIEQYEYKTSGGVNMLAEKVRIYEFSNSAKQGWSGGVVRAIDSDVGFTVIHGNSSAKDYHCIGLQYLVE